jgi:hypothetical protein
VASVGVDELGALQRDLGIGRVEPEDRFDLRMLLQPAREPAAEKTRDSGD